MFSFKPSERGGRCCLSKRAARSTAKATHRRPVLYPKGKNTAQRCVGSGEATLRILGEGDFFGEGGLAGQLVRMSSATPRSDCILCTSRKRLMMLTMSLEPKLSAMFSQVSTEAKYPLSGRFGGPAFQFQRETAGAGPFVVAQFGKEGVTQMAVPRLSQETLAEMVGTTPVAGELLHEPIQKARIYQLRERREWHFACPQLPPEYRAP